MKLNYPDRFDKVLSMTKSRKYKDMTYRTIAVYVEIKAELSWPIKPNEVYHET